MTAVAELDRSIEKPQIEGQDQHGGLELAVRQQRDDAERAEHDPEEEDEIRLGDQDADSERCEHRGERRYRDRQQLAPAPAPDRRMRAAGGPGRAWREGTHGAPRRALTGRRARGGVVAPLPPRGTLTAPGPCAARRWPRHRLSGRCPTAAATRR